VLGSSKTSQSLTSNVARIRRPFVDIWIPPIKYGAGPAKYKARQDFTGQAYHVRHDGMPWIGVQGRAPECRVVAVLHHSLPVTHYCPSTYHPLPITG
jgi:hypothetical protein